MIDIDEIVHLFRGDDDSFGYAHAELVVELCSHSAKDTVPSYDWCTKLLYGEEESVPFDSMCIIRDGVKLWYHRNRPRHKIP